MGESRSFCAACAAAAVVSCWGAEASGGTGAVLETNLSSALGSAYLLYGLNYSFLSDGQAITLGTVGSGEQSVGVKLAPFGPADLDSVSWALIGIDGAGSVSVTMWPGSAQSAIDDGDEWDDVFFGSTEAEISTALMTGDTAAVLSFWSDNFFNFGLAYGFEGTQVSFTAASDNGTAILRVPTPGAAALFGCAALAAAGRRRR